MMEFIDSYNLTGLVIGISTFLIIGLFHPVVIKCEYYFSDKVWPVFLVGGLISIAGSLLVQNTVGSSLLCMSGKSCGRLYWGFSPFLLFGRSWRSSNKKEG